MKQVKQLLSHQYCFPILIGVWAIVNILFGEKLPANNGLGWDGARYASLAQYLFSSPELDNYLALRVFPSLLVNTFFTIFEIPFTPINIIKAFEFINLASLIISAIAIKKIFVHFNIKLKNQLLGFTLIYLNFALSKFVFFYPVMTDTLAFCLGTLLFYFYITNQTLNLTLISLIAAFTWPVVFAQGIIFLCLPFKLNQYEPLSKGKQRAISLLSFGFALVLIIYFVLLKKQDTSTIYTLKIDYNLLIISSAIVLLTYYYYPQIIFNANFFRKKFLLSQINIKKWLSAILVLLIFFVLKELIHTSKQSSFLTTESFLKNPISYGLTRPFISIISHSTFYGVGIVLLIIFWKSISQQISSLGLGLSLAILLNLYLNASGTESRVMSNVYPWLAILLVVSINQFKFSYLFYYLVFALNLFISKIWLPINYADSVINEKGEIGFPAQKFFLNIGPWMNHQMWLLQGIILIFVFIIVFLSTHRINFNELKITPKYL